MSMTSPWTTLTGGQNCTIAGSVFSGTATQRATKRHACVSEARFAAGPITSLTACRPSEPPTGGRPRRPGKASSVGAWTGLLRGRSAFDGLRVTRSTKEN